jgi:hypothetical protein
MSLSFTSEQKKSDSQNKFVVSVGWNRKLTLWPDLKDNPIQSPRRAANQADSDEDDDEENASGKLDDGDEDSDVDDDDENWEDDEYDFDEDSDASFYSDDEENDEYQIGHAIAGKKFAQTSTLPKLQIGGKPGGISHNHKSPGKSAAAGSKFSTPSKSQLKQPLSSSRKSAASSSSSSSSSSVHSSTWVADPTHANFAGPDLSKAQRRVQRRKQLMAKRINARRSRMSSRSQQYQTIDQTNLAAAARG